MKAIKWILAMALICAPVSAAWSAPASSLVSSQRISVKVKRLKGTGTVLKKGIKTRVMSRTLQWDYIPGTSVSIPFITLQFSSIPTANNITVLAGRSTKLIPDKSDGYVIKIPLLRKVNPLLLTIVSAAGQFEDWEIEVVVGLSASAVFVDESCADYFFTIKELKRPAGPNMIYVGCRPGSGPRDLSLDILWGDIDRLEYMTQFYSAQNSVISVPLQSKTDSRAQIAGIHAGGKKSVYEIFYKPFVPPPYELWAGLAFFNTAFQQSNFTSSDGTPIKFDQLSTAFLGTAWYRPEDVPISVMLRAFGSLISFSDKLEPAQAYQESVRTYFLDLELRYRVFEQGGWKIEPLLGGWIFFMDVQSRNFGIQSAKSGMFGLTLSRMLGKRDSVGVTVRFVDLKLIFNPFQFDANQSYIEVEATYVHPFMRRNRLFATLYAGFLNYAPGGDFASTTGNYLVIGGGYGW